jgi:type IV pilus assembly protein PilV
MRRNFRRQFGFSLIEALVALVVISVGMIGIAILHGHGLGAARTALYRTVAVNAAADMAERIRANRLGREGYEVAVDNGCDADPGVDCAPLPLAQHERFRWDELLSATLPLGVGSVELTDGMPSNYTIRVRWQEVAVGVIEHTLVVRVPPT